MGFPSASASHPGRVERATAEKKPSWRRRPLAIALPTMPSNIERDDSRHSFITVILGLGDANCDSSVCNSASNRSFLNFEIHSCNILEWGTKAGASMCL